MMIQTTDNVRTISNGDLTQSPVRVWGMSAQQLHDAYWRAHGVRCVRLGLSEQIQSDADLFLLIESNQLVLFDLAALADQLPSRAVAITRVHVVGLDEEAYGEEVEINQDDRVVRIARRYLPRTYTSCHMLLTRRRCVAQVWVAAENRLCAWRRIRRLAGQSNIETLRCRGDCFTMGLPADECRLIDRLVETWRRPDRAIDGIAQVREAVWGPSDIALPENAVAVGPVWIGYSRALDDRACFIGPLWVGDDVPPAELNGRATRVRSILDIDPGDAAPQTQPQHSPRLLYNFAKRTLDITIAMVGPALMMPVLVLITICILVEDGRPIFYGQLRQTRGGRIFRCWKFRTMCHNADLIKQRLAQQNQADGPQFFMEHDPRVTRVGRVLRACHLDELPQLWNVLIGHMSLVGPRPSPENENQICPAWRDLRLSVRPGLTGLWQLERTRKPGADFQEWIRYDFEYIARAGFFFDLRLLWRTAWTVFWDAIKAFGKLLFPATAAFKTPIEQKAGSQGDQTNSRCEA